MKTLKVTKPWGAFEQYTHNENTTVKIIYINKGESLSLQYHNNRSEFWKILDGNPTITIGDNTIESKTNDEFIIEKGEEHRIEAKNDDVRFLEIAYGDFDEDDIVRLEDKYGRNKEK